MNEEIPKWMQDHIESDHSFQQKMEKEILPNLATREDLKGLATEKSVRESIHLTRNFMSGIAAISGGGKWFYRAVLVIATLLGALAVITGAWKSIFVWVLAK